MHIPAFTKEAAISTKGMIFRELAITANAALERSAAGALHTNCEPKKN